METCWLCPERFTKKADLRTHLVSKAHGRLRVVCPFCLGREKTFTKASDLKVHAAAVHPKESVSPGFFTTANGFFMARFPQDYRKLVTLGSWSSEEAVEARRRMTTWMATQSKADLVTVHWKAGWMEALEENPLQLDIERLSEVELGEDPDITLGEPMDEKGDGRMEIEEEEEDREEEGEIREEERSGEGARKVVIRRKQEVKDRVEDRRERSREKGRSDTDKKEKAVKDRAEGRRERSSEKKGRSDADKREKEVKDRAGRKETDGKDRSGRRNQRSTSRESDISVITEGRKEKSSEKKGRSDTGRSDTERKEKEAKDREEGRRERSSERKGRSDTDKREKEVKDREEGRIERSSERKGRSDTDKREKEVKDMAGRKETDEKDRSGRRNQRSTSRESDISVIMEGSWTGSGRKGEKKRDLSGSRESVGAKRKKPEEEEDEMIDCSKEEEKGDNVKSTEGDANVEKEREWYDTETDFSSDEEEGVSESVRNKLKEKEKEVQQKIEEIQEQMRKKEEERQGLDNSLKKRAEKILLTGAMPLCPPGRRNWNKEECLTVEQPGRTIMWPPRNFRCMTADERLLSLEYVAMYLEQQEQKAFPCIPRQLLLDTYNFLALPGTRKAYDQQDHACRKIRFYNYQLVRGVALGDITSNEAKELIGTLEMVQANRKETLAVTIAKKIASSVSLRLDQE